MNQDTNILKAGGLKISKVELYRKTTLLSSSISAALEKKVILFGNSPQVIHDVVVIEPFSWEVEFERHAEDNSEHSEKVEIKFSMGNTEVIDIETLTLLKNQQSSRSGGLVSGMYCPKDQFIEGATNLTVEFRFKGTLLCKVEKVISLL